MRYKFTRTSPNICMDFDMLIIEITQVTTMVHIKFKKTRISMYAPGLLKELADNVLTPDG